MSSPPLNLLLNRGLLVLSGRPISQNKENSLSQVEGKKKKRANLVPFTFPGLYTEE